jgi:leader peptidase (prepilin peptidase)/N-methyltransferase
MFIIGLAVGSFLNVVIYRVDDLKSIINTRSHCRHCQKTIPWYDLVPLLSFILLKGKCRRCKEAISWQYPLVELSTAIIFALLAWYFGQYWLVGMYALIYSVLVVVFVHDIKTQYVLDIFSWSLVVLSLVTGLIFFRYHLIDLLWGALAGGAVLGLLVAVSKEKWMGFGDVFIGASLGAILGGQKALLMIFLSFIIGSIYGLFLILLKKTSIKQSLPFTPFIIISSLISLLAGDYILSWYLGYIYMY